jgi:hypothetical protein
MEKQHVINIRDKAREAGIEMPVMIKTSLLEELTPTPFLASLGVSLEERVDNLFRLIKASLTAKQVFDSRDETRAYLPFMVVRGPFVREDCLPVIAKIIREGERSTIVVVKAGDNENSDDS